MLRRIRPTSAWLALGVGRSGCLGQPTESLWCHVHSHRCWCTSTTALSSWRFHSFLLVPVVIVREAIMLVRGTVVQQCHCCQCAVCFRGCCSVTCATELLHVLYRLVCCCWCITQCVRAHRVCCSIGGFRSRSGCSGFCAGFQCDPGGWQVSCLC